MTPLTSLAGRSDTAPGPQSREWTHPMARALYGITARRIADDELIRCNDATNLTELGELVTAYAAAFGSDPAVRVDVDTVPAR
ncbi:hypothetical protein ACFU6S_32670 [Streptomyces sp. NPDC057456]|uniref:hypothetical protein n=1 Tax=Streptomyces sp. NPDC057456 TaxID=3346139 RepID=UPI0036B06815